MRRRMALAAAALTLLAASPSFAVDDKERLARRQYAAGERAFDEGDYDGAIDAYKRAYTLTPEPGLLFNIAQAYRAKRDNEQAAVFYQAYLRDAPDGSERDFALARITELRAVPASAPPDEDRGGSLRTAGAVTAGAGLALVAAGLVFGVQALHAEDKGEPAGGAQRRAIYATGAGAGVLVAGGVMYYLGAQRRHMVIAGAVGRGGGQVSLTVGF